MYGMQLARLSDREILCKLEALVKREHQVTLAVVLHLGEVERRRLHVSLGYGSLFDYATKKLCYSASAAVRRIRVARCLLRYPAAFDLLRRNEVNLSTLGLASGILTPENADRVLSEIQNKSQREVEAVVARYEPASAVRDVVRVVSVSAPEAPRAHSHSGTGEDLFECAPEPGSQTASADTKQGPEMAPGVQPRADSGAADPESIPDSGPRNKLAGVQRFAFRFAAGPEFMAKFEEARALLSHAPGGSLAFESVFEAGLDAFLERHSPVRRQARRERRGLRKRVLDSKPGELHPATGIAVQDPGSKPSRHVPVAVRDEVFTRDGGRCSFVSANGERCESRYHVQVDHIEPFGLGGPGTVSNLRLLCAAHNLLEAERVYGPDEISRFRRPDPSTTAAGETLAHL